MRSRRWAGFTLLELIVVVFVIAFLLALLLPAMQTSRCSYSPRTACKNNLKQLGLAMHNYHDAFGCFPPGLVDNDHDVTAAMHTGFVMLLPFLEETALFNSYNFRVAAPPAHGPIAPPVVGGATGTTAQSWNHVANSTSISKQLAEFFCPSNRNEGLVQLGNDKYVAGASDYAMATGAIPLLCGDPHDPSYPRRLGGFFGPNSSVTIRDVTDGLATTVAMAEVSGGEFWGATLDTNSPEASRQRVDPTLPPASRCFVDQAWAVARIEGTRDGWPRGAILVSAFQQLDHDLKTDVRRDRLAAPLNPRLHVVACDGGDGPAGPCGSANDRLPPARSLHSNGAFFLMGDGSARFIENKVDRVVYGRLFTIAGTEQIGDAEF